ncbi:MAG: hypothetical protein M0Q26_04075 [Chitinophagaceae bacterium]|nr:hypothetical protein [Chitinophagaceae bacterium]MDP1763585.1 hypothetical protein [Sediminibacterium sp.]MDP1811332.1 hypothetical protein [Sediminibacterium sp.]MDP3128067.1 hypothetical protein [Sediminibacterium sp.]
MQDHLYKYLVLNSKLSIPQLGNIVMVTEPASVDHTTMQLLPPKSVFHFEEKKVVSANKSFFIFLAEEMGVEEVDASRFFLNFSGQLHQDIQEKPKVVLNGIGHFSKGVGGNIVFTQDTGAEELFPAITIEKEISEETEFIENHKDYWWFYAIILFVMGLGAIFYYYV